MTVPFRIAFVGTGLITRDSHLPAALSSHDIEVAALVDPVVARAEAMARNYGIAPRIASSLDAVLGSIDGAVIATPNDSHAPLAIACLDAGVGVLIEKPLASTAAEGRAILDAARATRTTVAVGYSTRYRPSTIFLKKLVGEGYFGRARRFVHQFGTPGGWAPLSNYNLDRRTAGGGVLVVTATHFLDRMIDLWGMPEHATLEDDANGGPEANCTAHFSFGGRLHGLEGIARYSKTTRLPSGFVAEFDQGIVTLADSDEAEIVFAPRDAPGYTHVVREGRGPAPARDSFRDQLEDFARACRGGTAPRVPGEDGLRSLELIEMLYANRRRFDEDWYRGLHAAPVVERCAEAA